MADDGDDDGSIGEILDKLEEAADGERLSVEDIREALGAKGFAPFLIVPPLIEISPIGGIPGVPTALAAIIILFAAQILAGRDDLWLPGFVERRSMKAERMRTAVGKLRPVGDRLDRWFHGRLRPLTRGAWPRIAAGIIILFALTVPPLELLPFASTVPMAAILLFGLAILVHDGLLMLVALAVSAIAVGIGGYNLLL